MKSTKRKRWVRHLRLKMRSTPGAEYGSLLDLHEVLKDARQRLQNGESLQRKAPPDARRHVRVIDVYIEPDGKFAVLLFRLIDKDAPDSVYEDFVDGMLEPHPKKLSQGNRLTAHLAISLANKVVGDAKEFDCVLEVESGISKNLVQERLCSVGARCGKGWGTKDGGVTSEQYQATFELVQLVGRSIRKELEEGMLNSFTLERRKSQHAGFDAEHLVKEERRKIELKVIGNVATRLSDIVKAAQKKANEEDFELIRAYYKNKDGLASSQSIDPHRADALEDLVGKVSKIELAADLHPDQSAVTPELCVELIKLLKQKP